MTEYPSLGASPVDRMWAPNCSSTRAAAGAAPVVPLALWTSTEALLRSIGCASRSGCPGGPPLVLVDPPVGALTVVGVDPAFPPLGWAAGGANRSSTAACTASGVASAYATPPMNWSVVVSFTCLARPMPSLTPHHERLMASMVLSEEVTCSARSDATLGILVAKLHCSACSLTARRKRCWRSMRP